MDKIEWDDAYNSGIENIDSQHREILSTLNQLIMNPTISVKSEEFNDWVIRITDLSQKHFEDEESLLEMAGYDDLDAHKVEHEKIMYQISEVLMHSVNLDEHAPNELSKIIHDWFVSHKNASQRNQYSFSVAAIQKKGPYK